MSKKPAPKLKPATKAALAKVRKKAAKFDQDVRRKMTKFKASVLKAGINKAGVASEIAKFDTGIRADAAKLGSEFERVVKPMGCLVNH